MGKLKADTGVAEAKERRWFNGMTAFSAAAVIVHLGRIALDFWSRQEVRERRDAAGLDERQIGSIQEFVKQVQQTNLVAQAIVTVLCLGFLITGAMWIRAVRRRKAVEKARLAK